LAELRPLSTAFEAAVPSIILGFPEDLGERAAGMKPARSSAVRERSSMFQNKPKLRLISSRPSTPQPVRLTVPEKRVLDLVLLGESNKEIARRLDCTVKNVEYHVTNILKRTGMPTRLKLVARMANTSEHRVLAAIR
jgi:DNA-binding NarL/FixJ family response regulator